MTPDGGPDSEKRAKKTSFKRLLPLAAVVVAIGAVFALGLDDFLSFETLKQHHQTVLDWYQANRVLAVVCYFFVYAVVVALSLPGAVWVSLVGGYLFGTVMAATVTVFAATLGAVCIFLIARYALADFFREKAGNAGRKMEKGFRENALSYLLVLRLVPLFPFWLVNLVPALLGVPVRTFIIGTFFGIIPGTVVFCSIGNGLAMVFEKGEMPDLGIIFQPEIFGPLLALSALSLVPVVYKKFKASKDEAG
ncbi:MAG: TVP38/TMEM64 family protein [Rhodospirillales bacterium]|nr:TVP38/TMEM64 family protein [Rhodospirillales bacterium]